MHQQLGINNQRTSIYYLQSNVLVKAHSKILKMFENVCSKILHGVYV